MTKQDFTASMVLNLPAIDTLSNNLVTLLNYVPHGLFDLAFVTSLGGAIGQHGITKIAVGPSHWENIDGRCAFVATVSVWSDPITAADLTAIIIGASLIITAALIAVWVALGAGTYSWIGAIILAALAISGTLAILSVLVRLTGDIITNPFGAVVTLVALGVGGYLLYIYFKGRKKRAPAKRRARK